MEGTLIESLSYQDQVLHFLFPQPTTKNGSPHVHALTRLLVTLSDPLLSISLLDSLVLNEELLAYQFAFELVEGGDQGRRSELPEGDEVSSY